MYSTAYPHDRPLNKGKRVSSDMAAYSVAERKPGQRYTPPACLKCGGVVERWAAPLDVRVGALCDRCQRAK